MTVLPTGLIYHPIEHLFESQLAEQFAFKTRIRRSPRDWLYAMKSLRFPKKPAGENEVRQKAKEKLMYKSVWYHAFNVYAFALLKQHIPDHHFWKTDRLRNITAYLKSEEYRKGIIKNRYGYPYNPPGFEIPYSLTIFGNLDRPDLVKLTQQWTNEQFRRCYNPETHQMDRNTEDPMTHTARLYEIARMPLNILGAVEVDLPE